MAKSPRTSPPCRLMVDVRPLNAERKPPTTLFCTSDMPSLISDRLRCAMPDRILPKPCAAPDTALNAALVVFTNNSMPRPIPLKPSTMRLMTNLAALHRILNCATMLCTPARTMTALLYRRTNQLTRPMMPFKTLVRLSRAKSSTLSIIISHPLSVRSNSALHAPFNSATALMSSS